MTVEMKKKFDFIVRANLGLGGRDIYYNRSFKRYGMDAATFNEMQSSLNIQLDIMLEMGFEAHLSVSDVLEEVENQLRNKV